MDAKINNVNDDLFVVTENYIGQMYTIQCTNVRDLIEDWKCGCKDYHGDSKLCPPEKSRVFFASWNNNPFNPHDYTDFGSFMDMLTKMFD